MKLGLGQILLHKLDRSRWQVVSIGPQITLQRMVLTDTGGPRMEWLPPMQSEQNERVTTHRAHVELLYEDAADNTKGR